MQQQFTSQGPQHRDFQLYYIEEMLQCHRYVYIYTNLITPLLYYCNVPENVVSRELQGFTIFHLLDTLK